MRAIGFELYYYLPFCFFVGLLFEMIAAFNSGVYHFFHSLQHSVIYGTCYYLTNRSQLFTFVVVTIWNC